MHINWGAHKYWFSNGAAASGVVDLGNETSIWGDCETRSNTFDGANGTHPAPLNAEVILDREKAFSRALIYADNHSTF